MTEPHAMGLTLSALKSEAERLTHEVERYRNYVDSQEADARRSRVHLGKICDQLQAVEKALSNLQFAGYRE